MNKNVNDIDDLFKNAYHQFEEEPSYATWEKINAGLDKKDADSKRRKFVLRKMAVVVLLLIAAGFVLYDLGIFKIDSGSSKNNLPIVTGIKKSHMPEPPSTQNEINDGITPGEVGIVKNDEKGSTENSYKENNFQVKQNDVKGQDTDPVFETRKIGDKKAIVSDPWLINKQLAIVSTRAGQEGSLFYLLKKNDSIIHEKISWIPLNEKNYTPNPDIGLFNSVTTSVQLPAAGDTAVKNNLVKIKKPRKKNSFVPFWLLTVFASYERAGYRLNSELPTNITSIKHREVLEPSFSGRILATRQFTKNWGLQTGLVYSNTAIGITSQKLYALQDPVGDIAFKYITSSGYAYIKPGLGAPPAIGDSLITTEGKHTLQFISIPVMTKYSLSKNKFTITPGAGIEANFLLNAKVETEIEHPSNPEIVFINKLDGAKPFHLSVVADAELRYQVNKKLSVSIRPAFRYAVSPITENNVVETFPYSLGVGSGLTLKF